MRICLVYDCLFPHTVGGAERWYRNLAERLAQEGHEVTYLTMRQWEDGELDAPAGVAVVAASPRMALYVEGRRRTLPPLAFGAGVLWHLLRRGRRYDVVHTASFPYFSLLAAAAARPLGRFGLVVDWFELWSRAYWREYLGAVGGRIGWAVQALCLRVPQRAFAFAALTARRLRAEGVRGDVEVLRGLSSLPPARAPRAADPLVVFAGRLIPEKRAPAVVRAVMAARERIPGLEGVIFGNGPERDAVHAEIERLGAGGVVRAPGFVPAEEIEDAMSRALCLLAPSRREGYGLVVVEASAAGVPSVVVADEDNAAVELVEEGVNGFVAASLDDLPAAIERVHAGGEALRRSTAAWYARHGAELSVDASLDAVAASYRAATSAT